MDVTDDRPAVPGVRLERLIGEGAHAQVWRGVDERTAATVAVKIARDHAEAVAHVAREASLLRRFDHPHLVRLVRAVDRPGGGLALVLEFAAGGSVAALVAARGAIDPPEVTTVVVPVARALAALHRVGLAHGDVTASNVLLMADGRPVLADLGVGVSGGGTAAWGTPGWIDPALTASPRRAQQAAADVWSLGALLRFCLTGDPAGGVAGRDPRSATLLEVAAACGSPVLAHRPSAAQVPAMVWQACPPAPVRLLDAHAATRPTASVSAPELTRRIRSGASGAVDPGNPATATTVLPGKRGTPSDRLAPVRVRPPRVGAEPSPDGPQRARPARPSASARRSGVQRAVPWVGLATATALVAGAAAAYALSRLPEQDVVPTAATPPAGTAAQPSVSAPQPSVSAPALVDVRARAPLTGPELVRIVRDVAAARARAISAASLRALDEVDLPGSPAMAADRAVVDVLTAHSLRLQGLSFTVTDVRAAAGGLPETDPSVVGPLTGTLDVTAQVATSAHRQVDGAGRPVADVPAQPVRSVRLHLVRTGDGWRVQTVQTV